MNNEHNEFNEVNNVSDVDNLNNPNTLKKLGRPKSNNETRSKRFSLSLPPSILSELEKISHYRQFKNNTKCSITDLINEAVKNLISKCQPEIEQHDKLQNQLKAV